ncbi:hypothetical protein L6Q21_06175 [Sandaracinobacter sp. RS1-74]|uniref:hypothetical protein n=1 Tax=Sandaracinobacteroides sayramensis TaxID=2913411 RepID=UPI001EDABC10|nr:hypothetical protein [Sandaracinobacteroides sayramensis]MCG2840564.1 hypothetical protein [Sandaracinobacteroides sayramensis]
MNQSAIGFEARRRWLLWALAIVCLVWLALAVVANFPFFLPISADEAAFTASLSRLLPPVMVLLLVLAFLRIGRRPLDIEEMEARVGAASNAAFDLESQLGRIQATLGACASEVERMRLAAAPTGDGLAATAQTLEVAAGNMALSSDDMGKAAARLLDLVPGLSAQATEAEAALRIAGSEARRQLETVEASLSQVAAHSRDAGREAESMIASMQSLIAQIDQSSSETTKTIANRAYTLDAAVTGVLDRSAEAFKSIGDTLQEQARRVEQMVATARNELDAFGSDGTRVVSQRLDVLLGAANQLKQQFLEHQALTGQLNEAATQSLAAIEGRIDDLRRHQGEATQALVADTDGAISAIEGQFGAFRERHLEATRNLVAQADSGIAGLEGRLGQLRERQVQAAEALMADADGNAAAFEARLVELAERQRLAESEQRERLASALTALEAQVAAIGARQQEAAGRLQQTLAEVISGVEQRLEALKGRQQALGAELEAGAQAVASGVEQRLEGLAARQTEVRARLEADAAEGIEAVETRLAGLRARQQELAQAMQADAAEGIAKVEARFAALGASGADSLREAGELIARALSELDGLGEALSARQELTQGLKGRIDALAPAFEDFAGGAQARIPELARGLDHLSDRGRNVAEQLDALAGRIESQVELLRDSAAAFERDHAAVANLAQSLAGEFDTARAVVGEIHSSTEQTAITAAARMVENVMQVRQAVNSTSAEIRELLNSVVAEAEQSLDIFASTKAEAAFGAPIRLQIAALEDASVKAADAAGAASERLSGRLVDLMRTIAETEARIDEVDTRMEVRARDTLAARSLRLVDSLQAVSVDVARLLAVDVGDSAWARYLKGDRSLFARATVRLADKETARRISRHYNHDSEFQAEAARYLDQFEELIRRVLKDPDGEAFALVLLSSDIGKLYVIISEAIGRPIARR